jgi:hypothetical protein
MTFETASQRFARRIPAGGRQQRAYQGEIRVAEIPCKPGAGLGKDRLKSAGAIQSQALLTESHGAGISG